MSPELKFREIGFDTKAVKENETPVFLSVRNGTKKFGGVDIGTK